MNKLLGKGYYIWKAINCMAGRPQEIADAAFSADLGHVLIKIADGVFRYNVDVDLPTIVAALQAAGVTVWGWQYIYGGNPAAEAAIAIRQIQATGVTGFTLSAPDACGWSKAPRATSRCSWRNSARATFSGK